MAVIVNYRGSISCSGCFSIPMMQTRKEATKLIPVKIIANYGVWKNWLNRYYEAPDEITFETIASYLFRLKKADLFWLERFATDSPDSFAWQFYTFFLNVVDPVNPGRDDKRLAIPPYNAKAGDRQEIIRLHFERQEIIRLLRWLYPFLLHWRNQKTEYQKVINTCPFFRHWKGHTGLKFNTDDIYPIELQTFCKQHNLSLSPGRPIYEDVTDAIVSVYPNPDFYDGGIVYHYYIKGRITRTRRNLAATNFLPAGTPLESFLKINSETQK